MLQRVEFPKIYCVVLILFSFCRSGNDEAAKMLLDYGAKPNITNNVGQTPLHIAAEHGFPAVVELLLMMPETNLVRYL